MMCNKALITLNSVFPINVGGKTAGGIEVYAVNLAQALAQLGWTVDIVASKDSTSSIENVNIVKLGVEATKTRESRGERGIKFDWKNYLSVVNSLKLHDYNLVVINNHNEELLRCLNFKCTSAKIIHYNQILPIWKDCKDLGTFINKFTNIKQFAISDLICKRWNNLNCNYKYLSYGFIDKFTGSLDKPIHYGYLTLACRIIPEKKPDKLFKLVKLFEEKYSTSHNGILGEIIGVGTKGEKYYDSVKLMSDNNTSCYINEEYSGDNSKWIKLLSDQAPIVVSLARIEALGITPIEAFMCGLPCFCIKNENSAVSETLLRGNKIIFECNKFIITNLGGIANTDLGFVEMVKWCIDNKPFNRHEIRKHYLDNYSMQNHINNLLNMN